MLVVFLGAVFPTYSAPETFTTLATGLGLQENTPIQLAQQVVDNTSHVWRCCHKKELEARAVSALGLSSPRSRDARLNKPSQSVKTEHGNALLQIFKRLLQRATALTVHTSPDYTASILGSWTALARGLMLSGRLQVTRSPAEVYATASAQCGSCSCTPLQHCRCSRLHCMQVFLFVCFSSSMFESSAVLCWNCDNTSCDLLAQSGTKQSLYDCRLCHYKVGSVRCAFNSIQDKASYNGCYPSAPAGQHTWIGPLIAAALDRVTPT